MDDDVDTFLTTVYCVVDDSYRTAIAPTKPARPGHRPAMSDSEVLTLMLLGQWRADRSLRALLRYVRRHWRGYFPRLLSQSALQRRVQDLAGALCRLGPALAEQAHGLLSPAADEVLDGVLVPLLRRCRGVRHRCFRDEAALGRGGSDRRWAYGVKLEAALQPGGVWSGFVYGPANTEEHFLAEALFAWRQEPNQPLPTAAALDARLGPAHRGQGRRQGPTGPVRLAVGAGSRAEGPYVSDLGLRGGCLAAALGGGLCGRGAAENGLRRAAVGRGPAGR